MALKLYAGHSLSANAGAALMLRPCIARSMRRAGPSRLPVPEYVRGDVGVRFRVVFREKSQRLLGKHHPEAERSVVEVLLDQMNVGFRPRALQQIGAVQTRRLATDDCDLQSERNLSRR